MTKRSRYIFVARIIGLGRKVCHSINQDETRSMSLLLERRKKDLHGRVKRALHMRSVKDLCKMRLCERIKENPKTKVGKSGNDVGQIR